MTATQTAAALFAKYPTAVSVQGIGDASTGINWSIKLTLPTLEKNATFAPTDRTMPVYSERTAAKVKDEFKRLQRAAR